MIEEMMKYVEEIVKDLPSVEWTETTPRDIPAFKEHGAKTFSGTGDEWSHNLVVFLRGAEVSYEGSAVNRSHPTIVRYTPAMAKQAFEFVKNEFTKNGGPRG